MDSGDFDCLVALTLAHRAMTDADVAEAHRLAATFVGTRLEQAALNMVDAIVRQHECHERLRAICA